MLLLVGIDMKRIFLSLLVVCVPAWSSQSLVTEAECFFTVDASIFDAWRESLPIEDRETFDLKTHPFGTVFVNVERRLFGSVGGARLIVSRIPTESEDVEAVLFRAVFLVKILNDLNILFNPDDTKNELSDTAVENLSRVSLEAGMDLGELSSPLYKLFKALAVIS